MLQLNSSTNLANISIHQNQQDEVTVGSMSSNQLMYKESLALQTQPKSYSDIRGHKTKDLDLHGMEDFPMIGYNHF